jgi:hypothetical protein
MIEWPQSLVVELAARRCIAFLGAGASAGAVAADSSTSPPSWKALISAMRASFEQKQDHDLLEKLVNQEKYLDAAEILLANVSSADFSQFLRDTLVVPRFKPSKVHEAVLALDPKVILTTNWDDIYDKYCQSGDAHDGYIVAKYYDENVVSTLRSPVRLVLKAHGCITNSTKVIFTRSQYFGARQLHYQFYRVLDSLFLTNTILFLGYSLSDPDIQLVLENATIAAPSSHPHYALLPDGQHPAILEAIKSAYNVHAITYPNGDYAAVEEGLAKLAEQVAEYRAVHVS